MASSDQVESVVSLSESRLYRRKFASVYDSLNQVEVSETAWLKADLGRLDAECGELDGVEVYSGDSRFIKRSEANTLEARMKRLSSGERVFGHETYWTMRLSDQTNSWAGVVSVKRMEEGDSVSSMAVKHMKALDAESHKPKLMVLDAGHGMDVRLGYQACSSTDIVMRLKTGQVFYDQPDAYQGRGRPPLHGKRFKLDKAKAETQTTTLVKGKRLRISTWRTLP